MHQTTIAGPIRLSGHGLHTGRAGTVTLRPAPPGTGRRVASGRGSAAIGPESWVPTRMSTSVRLDDGRAVRTIEHLMAALTAHGVDNVEIGIDGPEVPILDGSAARWCKALHATGLVAQDAPRRAIRIRRPVQVARYGGFLRAEPAPGFSVDVTHDVLPAFPVMRWRGEIDAARFDAELARSRSFGNLYRRLGLAEPAPRRPPGAQPNEPDSAISDPGDAWAEIAARGAEPGRPSPLLHGWRPWRATIVAGTRILPSRRFADEPVRHVTLDMIGDLAFAGLPLVGRIVAHNPSHEKTFALVLALMASPDAWEVIET